jgi:hypothetical protein
MRALAILAVVALGACDTYAHRSLLNAPGNVDLSQPLPRENGDPKRIELPEEPGSETIALVAAPYIVGGTGRYNSNQGSGEVGLELHVERTQSDGRSLLAPENWSVTAGLAFAQWGSGHRTVAPGAFYAELGYRFFASYWPIEVGLGPALYVDDTDAGGQLSVRCMIAMVRARYLAKSGGEVLFGIEVPVPFFFSWSR